MYKDKGLVKVFNGKKYKIVSYLKTDNTIMFTTSVKTKKYAEITKTNELKVLEEGNVKTYIPKITEDEATVDKLFKQLKTTKAIPPIIPRKNKIIIEYTID